MGKVLDEIKDVSLPCCSQVFSYLNLMYRGIFETHKSRVQEREFYGVFFNIIDLIPKTYVGEVIGYWMKYF